MNRKPTPTFRVAMRRGLVQGLVCAALVCTPPAIAMSLLPIPMVYDPSPGHSQTSIPRVERMVESGRCWVGDAPADVTVPGHVWADGKYLGERGVSRALEQIFDGVDHGMRVQAFCR